RRRLPPLRRDRGFHHRGHRRGQQGHPDQDRLPVALRPSRQVQPVTAHPGEPRQEGPLPRRAGFPCADRRPVSVAGGSSWKRLVPLGLLILLMLLQFQLWFGVGNVPSAMKLKQQVEQQDAENAGLAKRNAALAAEVADLKQGSAAIEERARTELGMVKKG